MNVFENRWWLGARPKTLPASVIPVLIGAGCAVGSETPVWWRIAPALIVSLALQVGVNYANDYSDGIKGTDNDRVGPLRLVASGTASAPSVKRAAFLSFGVAAVAGLVLASTTTYWLIPVGLACIAAGWFYTGGPSPYGYAGLGEVFVFVFFGLLATAGTTYVISENLPAVSFVAGAATGCLACALLVINNLRDIPTDRVSGKRTLAVRIGDAATRGLFVGLIVASAACIALSAVYKPVALIALLGFGLAGDPVKKVRKGAVGSELIAVLGSTAKLQLFVGTLLAVGLALS